MKFLFPALNFDEDRGGYRSIDGWMVADAIGRTVTIPAALNISFSRLFEDASR